MIPLLKTDRSIGKSIIQVETPKDHSPEDPDTVVTIALQENWSRVYVVDDEIGGFIPIYKECQKKNIELCYGLRLSFEKDVEHKLIVFITSEESYKALIKLSTFYNTEADQVLSFDDLHRLWHPEMFLAVPFYDSFLYKNSFTKKVAIPDFRGIKPFIFLEENDLPFDSVLRDRAISYAENHGFEVAWVKSIYYNRRQDITPFQIKKLMNRQDYGSNTMEAPNLEWFMSDHFCVEAWRENQRPSNENFENKFTKLELFLPGVRLPDFEISKEDKLTYGIEDSDDYNQALRKIAREGMRQKIKTGEITKDNLEAYGERAKYELDVLEKTKFSPYIMLVWDVMNFVNKNKLSRNPGRGSATGCLINYLIGITEYVDPLKYTLYFERFISASRASHEAIDGKTYLKGGLPDIDCDIGHLDRAKVFDYLQKKYPNRISKVSTVGTLTTKKLVTEICKIVLGFNKDQAKLVSDMIPVKAGKVASPKKAYNESEKFKEFCDNHEGFLDICFKLHNSVSSRGKHASAVLLCAEELEYFMPLTLDNDGNMVTAYDQDVVNEMAIKLDLLGVKNTTVVYNTCERLGINPLEIPFDSDDFIYKPLANLENPWGLFQISGTAAVGAIRAIKPRNLNQISDVIAIIRPGASEFIGSYADVNNGAEIKSLHPFFDPVLKETNNTVLYQEQTMKLVNMCGFSLQECDEFRRMIGKKKSEEMATWKPKFYERGKEKGVPVEALDLLWNICEQSADYSFNRCLDPKTKVVLEGGSDVEMREIQVGQKIKCFDLETEQAVFCAVKEIFNNQIELFRIDFWESPTTLNCSWDHKILCSDKIKRTLGEIWSGWHEIYGHGRIKSFTSLGRQTTLDFHVDHEDHLFFGNDIVVSNSHSLAYSVTAAQTVYLKNRHPREFFLESLKVEQKEQPKEFLYSVAQIITELKRFGIKLLPPSFMKSGMDFQIEGNDIRFGLSAIKGAGGKAAEAIRSFMTQERSNKFEVFNAAKQSKINSSVFSGLAEVGAMAEYDDNRHRLSLEYRIWSVLNDKERTYCLQHGEQYNFDLIEMLRNYDKWISLDGKRVISDKKIEGLRTKCAPYFDLYKENFKNPQVSQYLFEKQLIGYSFSWTLRQLFTSFGYLNSIEDIIEFPNGREVNFVGTVAEVHTGTSKKGNKKIDLLMQDETGEMRFMMTGEKAVFYLKKHGEPEEGQIIHLKGSKSGDIVFVNDMAVQHLSIFKRVTDLKKIEAKEKKELDLSSETGYNKDEAMSFES